MFVVQLVITSIILLGLLISNVLTVVLISVFIFEDEHSNRQGADYYIVSLAISDLILGVFLIPFSLISLSFSEWTFGSDVCAFYAYLWFSQWLLNVYTFLLMSADRWLYITDKKYCQYTNRTRVRCICEIFLAWSVALAFSSVPAPLYGAKLVRNHLCTINWHGAVGFFAAVIIATVIPCLVCSLFNFIQIFYLRMLWKLRKGGKKLSAASVEYLLDPTHVVCLVLFLVFCGSWMPFSAHIYWYLGESQEQNVYAFWLGISQGVWKFPILIIFCPRYRQYFIKPKM